MSKLAVTIEGHTHEVEFQLIGTEIAVKVEGATVMVMLPEVEAGKPLEWLLVDGRSYEIGFDPEELTWLRAFGGWHPLEVRDLEATASRPRSADGRVKAPIPGHIRRVMVQPGQAVDVGQPLLVLEAMKMENEIRAPRAGQISAVHVKPGQGVVLHEVLAEIS